MAVTVTKQDELAEYVGRFTYMSGAQSKAAHQIMAKSLIQKLVELGFVTVTTPVQPTVLIVREPDSPTEITVSPEGSVRVISADLGSSFDGSPDPEDEEQVEVAQTIIARLTEGTADLPEGDPVREAANGWIEHLTSALEGATDPE